VIEAPLWVAPFTTPPSEPVPVPDRADVAIAGAGYTGLAAALGLARRGLTTVVLEADRVGSGASSRNGGMVLTGLKLGPETLVRRYGAETARALFGASLRAINAVEQIVDAEGIDCAYSRCGHLELACSAVHFNGFIRAQKLLDRVFEHRVEVLSRDELAQEIGSSAFYGGLLDESSGGIDPYRYALGLAGAARRAGATIAEQAPVRRVERDGAGWRVQTSRGEIAAPHLIVATGAYTGAAFAQLRRRIVPVGSYIIATESLSAEVARDLIPRSRMCFDSKRLLHYFRLTPDSRMLFGGRAAFVPATPETTRQSARVLQRDMIAAFPQLEDARVDYGWGGSIDVAFDAMPHAGQMGDWYYAAGYAGHGVALATLLGTLVARSIVEGRPPAPFERALPQAPLGLYDGRPWFLPFVGAWARLADMLS